ncbi:unnamed protein product, partial [Phaeothamnion confervicola]
MFHLDSRVMRHHRLVQTDIQHDRRVQPRPSLRESEGTARPGRHQGGCIGWHGKCRTRSENAQKEARRYAEKEARMCGTRSETGRVVRAAARAWKRGDGKAVPEWLVGTGK